MQKKLVRIQRFAKGGPLQMKEATTYMIQSEMMDRACFSSSMKPSETNEKSSEEGDDDTTLTRLHLALTDIGFFQ